MPVNREEIEIVDLASKSVFDKMERGKFYSSNEISGWLVKSPLFTDGAFKKYIPLEYTKKENAPMEELLTEIVAALMLYLWDVSYVQAFLWSQVATGKLEMGYRKGEDMPYYSKV